MRKTEKTTIDVQGTSVTILNQGEEEYISLSDIARYRDAERTDYIIQNWLRNRNTIEFLGIWEGLNNPGFNSIEFDGFKKQAGINSFTLTPKQWRDQHPGLEGNMRDYATIEQLLVLANMESLNAELIHIGWKQEIALSISMKLPYVKCGCSLPFRPLNNSRNNRA